MSVRVCFKPYGSIQWRLSSARSVAWRGDSSVGILFIGWYLDAIRCRDRVAGCPRGFFIWAYATQGNGEVGAASMNYRSRAVFRGGLFLSECATIPVNVFCYAQHRVQSFIFVLLRRAQ